MPKRPSLYSTEKRKSAREANALIGATINMFSSYLSDKDWSIKENANMQKSVNGLNNYIREVFTKQYWLHEIYPEEVREAHISGDCHIHDLGFYGPYCAGWDLRQLLMQGFGGIPGKVESRPAKHLRSFLGQIVNSTFTTQGETAARRPGPATRIAPRSSAMTIWIIADQAGAEFIFNINVPTGSVFNARFQSDVRHQGTGALKDHPSSSAASIRIPPTAIGGDGQIQPGVLRSDAGGRRYKGRVFVPIPTLNITMISLGQPGGGQVHKSPANTAFRISRTM